MVCCHKISDIDQLKRVLIDCWAQLSQDMLNRAIDQLPKRLMVVIKVGVPMLNFVWTNHVCERSLLFHCVLSENSLKYALLSN